MNLSDELQQLRKCKKELDDEKVLYDAAVRAFKSQEARVFDLMENDGIQSTKVHGIQHVRAETFYAQVQDQAEFEEWALTSGLESYFEQKPRKKLLNELVREKLDAGEPLPPGLGFYSQRYISLRGGED